MENENTVATEVELTPEQANAKAEAEAKALEKAEAKERKAAEKAEAKAQKQAEKEAAAKAKAEAKAEALAKKQAEKAEASHTKVEMPVQNGIKRPKPEGKCGRTWAIFDALSFAKNAPVAIADAIPEVEAAGLSVGNARAEYAQWRKFNGITGKVPASKPVLQHADEIVAPETDSAIAS